MWYGFDNIKPIKYLENAYGFKECWQFGICYGKHKILNIISVTKELAISLHCEAQKQLNSIDEKAEKLTNELKQSKPVDFCELSQDQAQPYIDKACELLSNLHYCTRVWGAWSLGTMCEDDFIDANTNQDSVYCLAELLYEFRYSQDNII